MFLLLIRFLLDKPRTDFEKKLFFRPHNSTFSSNKRLRFVTFTFFALKYVNKYLYMVQRSRWTTKTICFSCAKTTLTCVNDTAWQTVRTSNFEVYPIWAERFACIIMTCILRLRRLTHTHTHTLKHRGYDIHMSYNILLL